MKKARIYKPSKNVMQSGRGKTARWLLEYDSSSERAPESLMGWTQSHDTLTQVRLKFDTLEDATQYAEKNAIAYFVQQPHERIVKPRNYGDNFAYVPPGGPAPIKAVPKAAPEAQEMKAPAKPEEKKALPKKAATKKPVAKKPAAKKAPAKKLRQKPKNKA